MEIDADILLWINGHYAEWLDEVMWTVSQARTWGWLYVIMLLLVIRKYRDWRMVLLILVGFGVAVGMSDFICSGVLKPWVCRLRPTHEPAIGPVRLIDGYTGGLYGFCSSHAANTMAAGLLFSLLYKNSKATLALMAWVALNAYSRMYLGVHYPSDILCGLLIGSLFAVPVYWGLRWALAYWHREDDEAAPPGDS